MDNHEQHQFQLFRGSLIMEAKKITLTIQTDSDDEDFVEIMRDDLVRMIEAILRREIVQTIVSSEIS